MNLDSLSAVFGAAYGTPADARTPGAQRVQSAAPQRAPAPAPALAPAEAATPALQLDAALDAVNRFLQPVATSLRFVKDESSGRIIVRVIDADTQQVLRQMPSEDVLAMNQALDRLRGLMVKDRA